MPRKDNETMKIRELRFSERMEEIEIDTETLMSIEFENDEGSRFQVQLNEDGNLEVTTPTGILFISPRSANTITLNSPSRKRKP
jgi:hypothetical protein